MQAKLAFRINHPIWISHLLDLLEERNPLLSRDFLRLGFTGIVTCIQSIFVNNHNCQLLIKCAIAYV